MPDPIGFTSSPPARAHDEDECIDPLLGGRSSTANQAGSEASRASNSAASKAQSSVSQEPPKLAPAVQQLIGNSRSNGTAQFVQNQKQATANTTAERTAHTPLQPNYHDAGVTADGSSFATVGLYYGRDPKSGVTEEIGTVSVQRGKQNEAQVTGVRLGIQNDDGDSITAELLTGHIAYGTHNKDGSEGANISFGVTLAGVEITKDVGDGKSATAGAAVGVAVELSAGTKDSDRDGKEEYCLRVAAPSLPFAVGGCVEEPADAALGWLNSTFGGGPAPFAAPPVVRKAP